MKILLVFFFCITTSRVGAQQVTVLKYEDLIKRIQQHDQKTVLVNFWATWCVPCIEEMPGLMQMNEKYQVRQDFKMLLVSLDSKKNLDKLPAFLEKHNMKAEVILLDDNKRMNEWIPAFDAKWQGSLPATLLYHRGKKKVFVDGTITAEQLRAMANKYLEPSK